jgi:hypothetical protein
LTALAAQLLQPLPSCRASSASGPLRFMDVHPPRSSLEARSLAARQELYRMGQPEMAEVWSQRTSAPYHATPLAHHEQPLEPMTLQTVHKRPSPISVRPPMCYERLIDNQYSRIAESSPAPRILKADNNFHSSTAAFEVLRTWQSMYPWAIEM